MQWSLQRRTAHRLQCSQYHLTSPLLCCIDGVSSSSAKRFPGVIPTTNLTRLFARQNVRLPTRQKRARGGSPAEVESGEAEGDDEE